MFLAWKKFHRSEDSICDVSALVCALFPAISEMARMSASTAIISAIPLLEWDACSACSACSSSSCAPMVCRSPSGRLRVRRWTEPLPDARGPDAGSHECHDSEARNRICGEQIANFGFAARASRARMGVAIGLEEALGVDAGIDLGGRQRGMA